MESFINLITFFNSPEERTIEHLAQCYNKRELMTKSIESLLDGYLGSKEIKGKRILLKPNWVKQDMKAGDVLCMRTNDNVIIAILEYLLKLSPTSIIVGDAPIQGCHWSEMLSNEFCNEIQSLSLQYGVPIIIKDFRKVKYDSSTNILKRENDNSEDYIIFDVGRKSWLEPITTDKNTFRVTCYNPDRLAESHTLGVHKYCVIKDLFESDVVITMPKMKTHQKAGLTNSLKILVGINGDKDYLPHHRIGAVGHGGDCYKGWHPLRRISELLLDEANRHIGEPKCLFYTRWAFRLWHLSFPTPEQNLQAGWYGNDTVWRMVMDLNMVAQYGCMDGTLSGVPQRKLYTLCDGIIGGQGDGPLNPEPLAMGVLQFSDDAFISDEVAGTLFSMNMQRIPLLYEAMRINKQKKYTLTINGEKKTMADVAVLATRAVMPPGWINYNK